MCTTMTKLETYTKWGSRHLSIDKEQEKNTVCEFKLGDYVLVQPIPFIPWYKFICTC